MRVGGAAVRVGHDHAGGRPDVIAVVTEVEDIERREVIDDLQAPTVGVLALRDGGRVGGNLKNGVAVVGDDREALRVEARHRPGRGGGGVRGGAAAVVAVEGAAARFDVK